MRTEAASDTSEKTDYRASEWIRMWSAIEDVFIDTDQLEFGPGWVRIPYRLKQANKDDLFYGTVDVTIPESWGDDVVVQYKLSPLKISVKFVVSKA